MHGYTLYHDEYEIVLNADVLYSMMSVTHDRPLLSSIVFTISHNILAGLLCVYTAPATDSCILANCDDSIVISI